MTGRMAVITLVFKRLLSSDRTMKHEVTGLDTLQSYFHQMLSNFKTR